MARAFGSDPLHQKSHGEEALCDQAKHDPPVEPDDEYVGKIGADSVRYLNEQV
jgi:hypothetical protein